MPLKMHPLAYLPLLLVLQLGGLAQAQRLSQPGPKPMGVSPGPELWVSGYFSNSVHRFNDKQGSVAGSAIPAPGAQSIVLGPDGLIYVAAEELNAILRFDGTRAMGAFVSDDPASMQDETGGLDGPTAAIFGPDGNLYVASFNTDAVLLYDGQSGAYLRHFINPGAGGLNGPDAGMTFGPDGHLYVPSYNTSRVLRYDGSTGASLGIFINQNSGGLNRPRMLLFRPDGELWVSSFGSNAILAYSSTGQYLRRVISLREVTGFAIGPYDQNIYAATTRSHRVAVFDWLTGQFIGNLVPMGRDGLAGPTFVAFLQPRR